MASGEVRQTSVVIIDSNRLFREGLANLCENMGYEIRMGIDNLTQLAAKNLPKEPILYLVGQQSKDENPEIIIKHLKTLAPVCHIVFLAEDFDGEQMSKIFMAGADGILPKNISIELLSQNLELIVQGEKIFPSRSMFVREPAAASQLNEAPRDLPLSALSDREIEIVRYLIEGRSNRHIADTLGITEATVKVHLKNILRKIRVANRTQVAIWAVRQGLAD